MQVIKFKQGRDFSYFDPEIGDFVYSEEPIECSHSYADEAEIVKKTNKLKGGKIILTEEFYDELNIIGNDNY